MARSFGPVPSMIGFAHPGYLLLVLAVPPLVWWWLRQRRPVALRYPEAAALLRLPPGRSRWARWGGAGMRALGLLCLAVAVAGPRWPDRHTRVTAEGIAIGLVVDVSGSMAERDFDWQGELVSRLEAIRNMLGLFVLGGECPGGERLEGRPEDLVGLVTFATRPDSVCPVTLSHSALLRLLEAERPRNLPTESETNIGDALVWGLHRLESAGPRRKVVLLFSDGEHNVPPPALKPRQAAQLAASLHVPVYAIDVGPEAGPAERRTEKAPDVAEKDAGEKALRSIARLTGGRYFRAGDSAALLAVCREIDALERQETPSFQYRRYHEGFVWFSLASLVFLAGVHALERTVWQRVP